MNFEILKLMLAFISNRFPTQVILDEIKSIYWNKQNHLFGRQESDFDIRNYSPEVCNIQQREAEFNINSPIKNNFDIKQKITWNTCFVIYPYHQTNQSGEC